MSRLTPRGRRWDWTRQQVFDRDGWLCTKCGKAGALEAHHVTPLAVDPSPRNRFRLAGIVTLCRDCHIRHHRRRTPAPPPGPERAAWGALVGELLD